LGDVVRQDHVVPTAAERKTQSLAKGLVVVDDQDAKGCISHRLLLLDPSSGARSGRRSVTFVPTPRSLSNVSLPPSCLACTVAKKSPSPVPPENETNGS